MTKFMQACAAACVTMALAGPAAAQIAGTYNGTSADGSGVQFTVGTDSNTGGPAITGALIFFSAPCRNSTTTLQTGWGYGMNADITNRRVTNETSGSYFDITYSLIFSTDGQSATGKILSISPDLDPSTAPPKKALFCVSPRQTLSLTYTGPSLHQPQAHVASLYDRKGRIIGQFQR
jgi:hypothetical protein